jgi:hypothetical protein
VQVRREVEAATDGAGRYRLCGVPPGRDLTVRAEFFGRRSDPVTVRAPEGAHAVQDLIMTLPVDWVTFRTREAVLSGNRGYQGIQGRVLDAESGRPLAGLLVTAREVGTGSAASAETNGEGVFRILLPDPGSFDLRAEALGYEAVSVDEVEVAPGRISVLEISVPPRPLGLEPMVVVAEPRVYQLEMQGFYQRERSGFGYFITPEEIEGRPPLYFRDLFRDIAAVEVYLGPASTPLQWGGTRSRCGAVVIWTWGGTPGGG